MLILWIILAIIGAALVYFGRGRERLLVYAGYLVFLAALVVFVLWLVNILDDNGVDTALVLLT